MTFNMFLMNLCRLEYIYAHQNYSQNYFLPDKVCAVCALNQTIIKVPIHVQKKLKILRNICLFLPQSSLFLGMFGTHRFYVGAKLMEKLVEIYPRFLLRNLQKCSYQQIYLEICTLTCKFERLLLSDSTSQFLLASLIFSSSFLEIEF